MPIATRSRRAHPGLLCGLTLLAGLSFPLASSAALVTYTMNGTGMTGSFAGTAFTDATWSITVTGDTDDVFEVPDGPLTLFWNLPAQQPAISIADGSNDWTALLLDRPDGSGGVVAAEVTPAGQPVSISAFALAENTTLAFFAAFRSIVSPGVPNDLATSAVLVGRTLFDEPLSLATSGGQLLIDEAAQTSASTFRVAVPLPGTLALVGLGLVGLVIRRRDAGAGRSLSRLG
jgi:hypothetical protein